MLEQTKQKSEYKEIHIGWVSTIENHLADKVRPVRLTRRELNTLVPLSYIRTYWIFKFICFQQPYTVSIKSKSCHFTSLCHSFTSILFIQSLPFNLEMLATTLYYFDQVKKKPVTFIMDPKFKFAYRKTNFLAVHL